MAIVTLKQETSAPLQLAGHVKLTARAGVIYVMQEGGTEVALAAGVSLSAANTWLAGQRGEVTTLTDGANIAIDLDDSNNFTVTLAGNRTLDNPSNMVAGQMGYIEIKQDATGSRTLTLGSNYKTPESAGITLSTAANAIDTLEYRVRSATEIDVVLNKAWG